LGSSVEVVNTVLSSSQSVSSHSPDTKPIYFQLGACMWKNVDILSIELYITFQYKRYKLHVAVIMLPIFSFWWAQNNKCECDDVTRILLFWRTRFIDWRVPVRATPTLSGLTILHVDDITISFFHGTAYTPIYDHYKPRTAKFLKSIRINVQNML